MGLSGSFQPEWLSAMLLDRRKAEWESRWELGRGKGTMDGAHPDSEESHMAVELDQSSQPKLLEEAPPSPSLDDSHDAYRSRPSGAKPRWRRWLAMAVVLVVIGAAAARQIPSWIDSTNDSAALTYQVARRDLVVKLTERGTLESSRKTEIKCRVKGETTVLWVIKTGSTVKPGDVLVRLDTSQIQNRITEQKIKVSTAEANKRIAESEVAAAQIAVTEYLEGQYESELAKKEQELVTEESNLKNARNTLNHGKRLFRKGYIPRLKFEAMQDAVRHAELAVRVKKTELMALRKFTKQKMLEELRGKLEAARARLAGYNAQWELESSKLKQEEDQLKQCVIRAEKAGLVIYPSAAAWQQEPDIVEGAKVREDQVLLIMPDLSQMQVKIGVHQSKVQRVKPGIEARIKAGDKWYRGKVKSVATVTRPSGWWTGGVARYDTIIELEKGQPELKPGMNVAVEVFLARHRNVLALPVATIIESEGQTLCWVQGSDGPERRSIQLGDSNDQFVIVKRGISEGETVLLNPGDFVDEARSLMRRIPKPADERSKKRAKGRKEGGAASSGGRDSTVASR